MSSVKKKKIEAKERIEVVSPGRVLGDIQSPVVSIEPGGIFDGSCVMKVPAGAAGKSTVVAKIQPAESKPASKPLTAAPRKKTTYTELSSN